MVERLGAIRHKRYAGVIALAAILLVAGVGMLAMRASTTRYNAVGDGLALGPAVRHPYAQSDVVIQIATGALSTAAGSTSVDLPISADTTPTAYEQALLDLTNVDRARNGLPALTFDADSLRVARVRAAAQVPDSPLSHYNSLGELAFVGLLAEAGVPYALAGENLARTTAQDAGTIARLNEALMNSPTHRANILEPGFNRLAVGAAGGADGPLALAEIFRSDADR